MFHLHILKIKRTIISIKNKFISINIQAVFACIHYLFSTLIVRPLKRLAYTRVELNVSIYGTHLLTEFPIFRIITISEFLGPEQH